jgi:hypothetical protein
MNTTDPRWHVKRSSPVRADADSLFVPVDDLAAATVGDTVLVSGPDGDDARRGVIAELTQGQGQSFFRLDLDH